MLKLKSKLGLVLVGLYLIAGGVLVLSERYTTSSGGWINLRGITTLLGTLPTSALVAKLLPSLEVEYSGTYDTPYAWKTILLIVAMMAMNAVLFYAVGAGLGRFWKKFSGNADRDGQATSDKP